MIIALKECIGLNCLNNFSALFFSIAIGGNHFPGSAYRWLISYGAMMGLQRQLGKFLSLQYFVCCRPGWIWERLCALHSVSVGFKLLVSQLRLSVTLNLCLEQWVNLLKKSSDMHSEHMCVFVSEVPCLKNRFTLKQFLCLHAAVCLGGVWPVCAVAGKYNVQLIGVTCSHLYNVFWWLTSKS